MKTRKFLAMLMFFFASPVALADESLRPDTLNEIERAAPVGPNAKADLVLRAQVLLERAHFSSGEIDAAYGSNLRQAINGYQKANGLSVSGRVDAATWAALNVDSAPILIRYILRDIDVAGPFVPVPKGMVKQAAMAALGYASVSEALGEKFHIRPSLLAQLNPGKDLGRAGEQIIIPNNVSISDLPKAAQVVVSGAQHILSLRDESGKTIAQFPATTGSKHDPLPRGNWQVEGIAHQPVFHYDPKLFWDSKGGASKASIAAGPNNPVGVVWIELSKAHYGIHGTPNPSHIGKTHSHGCIRLTNWDAIALAQSVGRGVAVLLQK